MPDGIQNLHFIPLELCSRPEFVDLERQETERQEKLDCATISSLPILDSFIKESVRLNLLKLSKWASASALRLTRLISRNNVSLTVAIRRKALKPFQFWNRGPAMGTEQITYFPAYDIMHNKANYPHPNEFNGLRFLKDPSVVPGGKRQEW